MSDVFQEALKALKAGGRAALATVVSAKGSLPMSRKAKMLVRADGTIAGTIGGGRLEADVCAEAQQVIDSGVPHVRSFTLTDEEIEEEGLTCGGTVEVFLEPLLPGRSDEVVKEIVRIRGERGAAVLATLVASGRAEGGKRVIAEGNPTGTLGDPVLDGRADEEAPAVLREDALKVVEIEREGRTDRVFLEADLPDPTLYLFGGGHISLSVAPLARAVGFRVVVLDDRAAFANPKRFPGASECIAAPYEGIFDRLDIDDASYLVSVTRGHTYDETVIEQAARTDARYIGMIGSRRKIRLMWDHLEGKGIPRARLETIHAPIGLDIGADTPEEIAVAIVAELIETRRRGDAVTR